MAVKLVVHRTYEVTLPDDKNYELKLDGKEYPFAELVTAAIDEFEAGRPNGMLLHVAGEPYVPTMDLSMLPTRGFTKRSTTQK